MKTLIAVVLLCAFVHAQDAPKEKPIDPSTMELLNGVSAALTQAMDEAVLAMLYNRDQNNPQRQNNCV